MTKPPLKQKGKRNLKGWCWKKATLEELMICIPYTLLKQPMNTDDFIECEIIVKNKKTHAQPK